LRGNAGRDRVRLGFRTVVRRLGVVLVEVENGIELGLPRQKLLQAGLMLERTVELRFVVGESLLAALDVLLRLFGPAIEAAENMLKARNGAERAVGIEIRLVGFLAPEKQLGLAGDGAASPA
jgi:hypothetical protein